MQSIDRQWFAEVLRKNRFDVQDKAVDLLESYVIRLLEWNSKINLISRASSDRIWSEHILHSISPLVVGLIPGNSKIIDVGSGGGLPGIPISILSPGTHITLLDSIKKKMIAVNDIISGLGLSNTKVITGRAEELLELRGKHDIVLARGVAPLKDLIAWSKILLRSGGSRILIAYKGGDVTSEILVAKQSNKKMNIETIDIKFDGANELSSSEKKILVVHL